MRLLMRNVTEFEYLPYNGAGSDLNELGEHTGEYYASYGDPEVMHGNISSPSGHTNPTFYGEDIRYTHTLVMDHHADISEHGMVRWKGQLYEVTAVRPTLNAMSVALRRITEGEDVPAGPEDGEG